MLDTRESAQLMAAIKYQTNNDIIPGVVVRQPIKSFAKFTL